MTHWLPGRQSVGEEEWEQKAISRRHKGCVECVSFRNIDPVWPQICPSQTVWPGDKWFDISYCVFPSIKWRCCGLWLVSRKQLYVKCACELLSCTDRKRFHSATIQANRTHFEAFCLLSSSQPLCVELIPSLAKITWLPSWQMGEEGVRCEGVHTCRLVFCVQKREHEGTLRESVNTPAS